MSLSTNAQIALQVAGQTSANRTVNDIIDRAEEYLAWLKEKETVETVAKVGFGSNRS